ncbi:MAG: globin [Gemmatimonadota bacterium]|nr:globin [Gemmatimonadota bacterium]
MARADVQIAESSYRRCADKPAFYEAFYEHLLASDPRIAPKFAQTDFGRQHRLLKHGLGLLIIYAKRPNPALIERIALRHSRGDTDVPAELYAFFGTALEHALALHDPEYGPEVAAAWRATLEPGIAYMVSRYEDRPA